MTQPGVLTTGKDAAQRVSWLPMVVIGMAQFLMSYNVAALAMSIGPMVATFDTPATTVGSAIVMYSLMVAAFVMLGGKLGQQLGSKRVFQAMLVVFGAAMVIITFCPTTTVLVAGEGLAGAAASATVPTLVVLIAANFKGDQQAKALGLLGAACAFAGVTGFLAAGILGTLISWRYAFALLIPIAVAAFCMSFKLKPIDPQPDLKIDVAGAVLAAASIILICFGFNGLSHWGILMAAPNAPFEIFGLSPAPAVLVLGIIFGQAFVAWSRRRQATRKVPLLALEVIQSREERSAVFAMFMIIALSACINFLVPLYIMIVQGRTSLQTGLAMMPYNLTILSTATLVVKLYDIVPPRRIARYAFAIVSAGLLWLAIVIRNDWSTVQVILGLILAGLGQGALVTLLFNVLVSSSPKELASDVGALRGTTSSLAAAIGTAFAAVLAVGLLSAIVTRNLSGNPVITANLKAEIDFNSIDFISNDRLSIGLKQRQATPEQVREAVRINTQARLQALKMSFLVLAGMALLAIVPSGMLPGYLPDRRRPDR